MSKAMKMSAQAKESLLSRLAKDGLMRNTIASFAGSTVYAVNEGWQLAWLKDADEIAEAQDSETFEAAVQDSDVGAIFVSKAAAMTLEIAERVLTRTGHPKTVFWEI